MRFYYAWGSTLTAYRLGGRVARNVLTLSNPAQVKIERIYTMRYRLKSSAMLEPQGCVRAKYVRLQKK